MTDEHRVNAVHLSYGVKQNGPSQVFLLSSFFCMPRPIGAGDPDQADCQADFERRRAPSDAIHTCTRRLEWFGDAVGDG